MDTARFGRKDDEDEDKEDREEDRGRRIKGKEEEKQETIASMEAWILNNFACGHDRRGYCKRRK